MSDPFVFDSVSPRFGLPLLFAGQAQKEAFVNEAHVLVDALLHCAIEGEADAAPADPAEGDGWMIGTAPTGAWIGQAGKLAFLQGGNWLFVTPRDGLSVLDRATGQVRRYLDGWQFASAAALPTGGTVIDAQARDAIAALTLALRVAGILPSA